MTGDRFHLQRSDGHLHFPPSGWPVKRFRRVLYRKNHRTASILNSSRLGLKALEFEIFIYRQRIS